jgi:dipeptidyl aminopeptidase/acylaminoacyl peptidase
MRFFLTVMMVFCANFLFAQKPVIDSSAYKAWPSLYGPTISKNGKYIFYTIDNIPVGSKILVVQSINGKWKKDFKGGLKDGSQTLSDKYFLFTNKNDSLGMLTLGTNQIRYITNISGWRFLEIKGTEFLAYTSGGDPKDLVLKNLKTNKEIIFNNVDSWDFDKDVLILFKKAHNNTQKQSINLVDITTRIASKIWEGYKPENLILDAKHDQLAFKTGDSVWYYKFDSAKAVYISDKNSSGFEPGLNLGYLESFSKDGKFIFTSLNKKGEFIEPKNEVVEIWSYTDVQLQTEQKKAAIDQKYLAVIDVEGRCLTRLQNHEREWFQFAKSEDGAKVALVENPYLEIPWSTAYKPGWDLVILKNGIRKHLNFLDGIQSGCATLSPSGKYIMYFDRKQLAYFSYEIATERIQNLTKGINVSWISIFSDDRPELSSFRGIAAWLKDDESLLVYDRYDIWKLDPSNRENPINLTNGYGKRNQVVFNYAFASDEVKIIGKNEKLYLTAFNNENKNNGFFLKQLNKAGDPELLNMGPYLYKANSGYVPDDGLSPMKANSANVYIVKRMSSTDAPNYFSTKDFKNFTRLSDLNPQKKYNWYTTELHSWKSLDGRILQGILYKPENFDPNKKYPVIFHYYERKSDGLNSFLRPEPMAMMIDIPTFVSNGYLVFTPDIYYKIGDPMQGTYDAIVSAADYVSTLPFVNSKKMGLQGGSWGGLQTNYLVTCTSLFAAACSSSGVADLISCYSSLDGSFGNSQQSYFENGQARIGASLWDDPRCYIKNSPIFHLEKVKTPLLIMHTRNDIRFAFSDAVELFTGLRRLGKKSWMLAYPDQNHGLTHDAIL